jgi:hypothetical protein
MNHILYKDNDQHDRLVYCSRKGLTHHDVLRCIANPFPIG